MKTTLVRRAVTAGTVLVLAATAAVGAYATVVDPPGRVGNLASFGPLMDNGFPTSFTDSNHVSLEACYTAASVDPLCAAAASPHFDPALPVSLTSSLATTNFPDEFFYQLASATLNDALGNKILVETNLEGAFATGPPIPGDQMAFARIRIKDINVPDGVTWRITHPYGVDVLTAGAKGIFSTADVGTVPGVFSGALNSRIGPFLKWDPAVAPAAPAGHIGDPGVLHPVVGSPYVTNFVKVEQLVAGTTNTWTTVAQTNLFSLQGRLAVNSGVNIDAANFTTTAAGASSVDVYASSNAGQAIQVSANAALGNTPIVPMREQANTGRYYARIDLPAGKLVPPGTTIEVVNAGDKPPAKKTAPLADQVVITTATYDAGTTGTTPQTLAVTATSSDTETGPGLAPVLTMADPTSGLPVTLTAGVAKTFSLVTAPPATVKVISSRLGSDTSQLTASGAGFVPIVPIANFVLPTPVDVGQAVPLDGTISSGGVTAYTWATNNGTITPSTTPGLATWTPTTVAIDPLLPATVTLTVVAPGAPPGGVSVTKNAVVNQATGVVVIAGPNQIKTRGTLVTLAATAAGQTSIAWTQVSGPPVLNLLSSTTTLTPTFTYPLMKLPVGPPGTATSTYVVANAPIVLRVTASGLLASGLPGTVSKDVTITPTAETITPITTRYRTRGDWRVTGTTNVIAGQVIAMVLGPNGTGKYIGQATVDAAGAFSFVGGAVPTGTPGVVTYISSNGATKTATLLITP
jgi:hypothetical protein